MWSKEQLFLFLSRVFISHTSLFSICFLLSIGAVESSDLKTLQKDIEMLESKENMLDSLLQNAECELRQLSENKSYAYITYADLKSIPDFADQTVIGIKAPPEAQLKVLFLYINFISDSIST